MRLRVEDDRRLGAQRNEGDDDDDARGSAACMMGARGRAGRGSITQGCVGEIHQRRRGGGKHNTAPTRCRAETLSLPPPSAFLPSSLPLARVITFWASSTPSGETHSTRAAKESGEVYTFALYRLGEGARDGASRQFASPTALTRNFCRRHRCCARFGRRLLI